MTDEWEPPLWQRVLFAVGLGLMLGASLVSAALEILQS